MAISNKKRKYIKRHAGRKPVAEIARDLGLSPEEVKAELHLVAGGNKDKAVGQPLRESLLFRLILALMFLAPFILINGITDYSDLPKKAFIGVGALLLLTIWLAINCGRNRTVEIYSNRLYLPLAFFIGWSLISQIWTTYRFLAFSQWSNWAACAVLFFLAAQEFRNKDRWESFLKVLALSAMLISFLGILQHLLGVDWVGQTAKPAATFANRNMAGHFIVMAFPATVYLFFSAPRTASASVWVWAMAGTIMAAYTFYTFTRAAWVCLTMETGLFALYWLHNRFVRKTKRALNRNKSCALAGALALLAILTHLGPNGWEFREKKIYYRISGMWDSGTSVEDGTRATGQLRKSHKSIKDRFFVWSNSLRMIRDRPWIGVGVQNYRLFFPATMNEVESEDKLVIYRHRYQAHNDYLQLTAELGLAGFFLILWMAWEFLRMAKRLLGSGSREDDRLIAAAGLTAVAGMSVNALFSFPLYSAIPPLIFGLYAAVLARICSIGPTEKEGKSTGAAFPRIYRSGPRFYAALTIALMALGGFGYLQIKWLWADRYISLQRRSISKQSWENAIVYGEKVRSFNPYRKDTLNYIGRAHLALGELDAAIEYLTKVGRLSPHDAGNFYHQATIYYKMGKMDKALESARKAAAYSLRDGSIHYLLGQVLGAQGKDREAMESFRMAAQYTPEKNLYHYNFGYYAYKEKKYAEAARALLESVKLDNAFDLAHKYLGYSLYYGLKRKEEGIRHLKASLEVNPKQRDAESLRKIIAEFEKTSQKAEGS